MNSIPVSEVDLREHIRKLLALLDSPEPGLFTWNRAVRERLLELKAEICRLTGESDMIAAAPELLAACKAVTQSGQHGREDCDAVVVSLLAFRRMESVIAQAEDKT